MPYLMLAVLGAAGLFAWRNTHGPTAPAASQAAPPQPSRLDFLTDATQPYQLRVTQLRAALATGCGEQDLRHLYQLLEKSPPQGELPEHWFVIANDIMIAIQAHESDPGRFSSVFIGLIRAPHQPEVIRDYAVQYLASWLGPHSSQAAASRLPAPSAEAAAEVLQSLAAAATDPALEQSSIPGTTLMMLVDLTRSGSGVDCSKAIATLKPWLTLALQDGSTLANPIRVSAITAAGILAPADFLPLIRNIAWQENGNLSHRLPAIAAIGQTGDAQDLPKLRQIAAVSPALHRAAQDAVATLTSRLASSH